MGVGSKLLYANPHSFSHTTASVYQYFTFIIFKKKNHTSEPQLRIYFIHNYYIGRWSDTFVKN